MSSRLAGRWSITSLPCGVNKIIGRQMRFKAYFVGQGPYADLVASKDEASAAAGGGGVFPLSAGRPAFSPSVIEMFGQEERLS